MIARRLFLEGSAAALLATTPGGISAQPQPAQVTILFDAFGKPSDLKRGWGYSSLIEYGGRRILFDTGASSAGFEHNAKSLGVDLKNSISLSFPIVTTITPRDFITPCAKTRMS
jgi:7,8-dihydropterin-6-yl-methyl-4-(beta-D-ribofuranosyl)aminobenzene 5'-phosphate synthase